MFYIFVSSYYLFLVVCDADFTVDALLYALYYCSFQREWRKPQLDSLRPLCRPQLSRLDIR